MFHAMFPRENLLSKATMIKKQVGLIGIVSATTSIGAAFLAYMYAEPLPDALKVLTVIAVGLVTGILQGMLLGSSWLKTIGISAFLGALLLWTPVVLVTYGFAVVALPLLAAFAAIVWVGGKLGAGIAIKFRRRVDGTD
ncbi:hypothetical protein [Janthinobacterium sp.]|uniref:hypothetical protein n=1 Tax=Janthinobacterium sp. TaxID=1871054 RepID=UPI002583013E|nr:hypothetical protein [Janthinobacterium sp.]MCX7294165.1 hypothetical protein [Janthinobacterium sp.]